VVPTGAKQRPKSKGPADFFASVPRPFVVAHRGDSARYPENTLASIQGAIAAQAPMAEVDLALSRDRKILLLHDETLDRTTDGTGASWEQDWADLSRLDAGGWFGPKFLGEPLPLLSQLLALAQGKIRLNLEIKPDTFEQGGERFLADLMAQLEQAKMLDQVLVSSFSAPCLLALQGRPQVPPLSYLSEGPLDRPSWELLETIDAWGFHTEVGAVSAADAEELKGRGRCYLAYTAADSQQARSLFALGVDGVFANDPHLLKPASTTA